MTDQEVFDKVARHLLAQGKRSCIGWICAYRGVNGAKCAIECLISDEDYRKSMEGKGVSRLMMECLLPSIRNIHIDLLSCLQKVHDRWTPQEWDEGLRAVALKFGLDSSAVDNFTKEA